MPCLVKNKGQHEQEPGMLVSCPGDNLVSKTALLIGGTGPSGPAIARGLASRGFEVTILHRGTHEHPDTEDFEHIHVDPHFLEPLRAALTGRAFDLTIATYGRIKLVAEAMVGHTDRFIAVGGFAGYRGFENPDANFPRGMPLPTPEDAQLVVDEGEHRFSYLIAAAEAAVFRHHPNATVFRYPVIFGPNQIVPREWSIVRRILDQRPHLILLDGGLAVMTGCYADNAAHAVLLAVDQPDASAGKAYNVGDDTQLTYRQIVEIISSEMQYDWNLISLPDVPAVRHAAFNPLPRNTIPDHRLVDTFKIRKELGYRDVVHPVEGVRRTVRWLLDNPVERGGSTERRMLDSFDYDAEDQLAAVWADFRPRLLDINLSNTEAYIHAYAHPKTPGGLDHHQR